MNRTLRSSLFSLFLLCPSMSLPAQPKNDISAFSIAKKHGIKMNKPAPDFFEGALLGNGGMGVVVSTRPDAVVLYFGHNNVWDIRIAEDNRREIRDFRYVFDRVKALPDTLANLTDDAWYKSYNEMTAGNYSKPYPRPFPCGSVVLSFDRRKIQLLGHNLDISTGVCTVEFLTSGKHKLMLKLFTAMEEDRLLMELRDENGRLQPNPFDRIKVMPDPSTPVAFPVHEDLENLEQGMISFKQVLPYALTAKDQYRKNAKDKAFRLTVKLNSSLSKKKRINWNGNEEVMPVLEAALEQENPFVAMISLTEGLNTLVQKKPETETKPDPKLVAHTLEKNMKSWKAYWNKSAIQLADPFLEEVWYRNLYFLNCATKAGVTCPGLFANWSYDKIGTAWHGDYHMNYNTQQPFWVTFSSNHLEKNLPYVALIESLMPVSRSWAKDYYGLPGAYFPHSAYPVEMTMNPYPIPDWGWEISETPWAVQGLWWHYLYSADKDFLKKHAYEPIKAAVEFLTAYLKRPDARGGERWKDDRYHIFPTVPPELYGLRPGFKYNYDGTIDLTLTKFIFKAFQQATQVLGLTEPEQPLLRDVKDILDHFPEYPTSVSKTNGKILVAVPGENDQVVYNVPNALITVFPGEDYGLHSDTATLHLLKNTYNNQQNEGGNDLVFINLQAARAGLLDLEEFKRHVRYSLLPNGTATDMVTQTGGRYQENTDYGYMGKMGIWFENFALPVVINECLLQSYKGTLRFFPNWPKQKDAAFKNLRAAGAFLVTASLQSGKVRNITILSEKGGALRLIVPWGASGTIITNNGRQRITTETLNFATSPGEEIIIYP